MGTVTDLERWLTGRHRPRLTSPAPAPPEPGDPRWELRGQPRTRATFADPHPGDFPGGLPLPAEYPDISPPITKTP